MSDALSPSSHLLCTLVGELPVAVFVVDTRGRPVYANEAACQLLGRGVVADADDTTLAEVYRAMLRGTDRPYPAARMPVLRALRGESAVVSDMDIEHPAGRIPIRVFGKPLYDAQGRVHGGCAVFMAITADATSHAAAADLAAPGPVPPPASATLTSDERLAILGRLAGSVSHDLRQPLSVILNSVHALRSQVDSGAEQQLRQIDRIARQAWQAERIIADLLDFARRREPNTQTVRLSDIIAKAREYKRIPRSVRIEVQAPETVLLAVDEEQIAQAIAHLLRNAAEAMQHEGTVTLTASTGAGRLRLRIEDEGHGLSAEMERRLFEPLVSTKPSGIGLGLVASKTYVERSGGKLFGANRDGGGAVFTIELPLAAELAGNGT